MVAGVFVARVLGEETGLPGLWAAVALSALLGAFSAWTLARHPLDESWPAFLLLAYVLYPEPNSGLAVRIAAVCLVTFALQWQSSREWILFPRRDLTFLPPLLATLVAFGLYVATLAPGVLAADSGELQVVVPQLGVAHPPGFPLYVMIGHLVVRLLPFLAPAYAINLFSAVTGAMTIGVVYHSVHLLSGRHLPAIIASTSLATATTYWSQATTANVRSLTGLFAALIILSLFKYKSAIQRDDRKADNRWLATTFLAMSFGLTHHVSLLFLVLVGLLFIILVDRSLIRMPRRWWKPVLAGSLGLLPLLYLPLRSSAEVRGASPGLATWSGFIEHALATGFRGDLFYYLAPAELGQRLLIMGNVFTFQFAPFALVGISIGAVLIFWRDKRAGFLLVGTLAGFVFVAATYRAPQTVEYMLPGYVAAVILLGYAISSLPMVFRRFGPNGMATSLAFVALVLVASVGQLSGHISASGKYHESTSAHDFVMPLLFEAPPDSIILAHWHWATALWYLREIEGVRTDVDIRFVYPEGEPYEETWRRRTTEAYAEGRSVVTTWIPPEDLENLPVPEPFREAILFPQEERVDLPPDFASLNMAIGDSIVVKGYLVDLPPDGISPGEEATVIVGWQPAPGYSAAASMFVHLVGPDMTIYAQDDQPVRSTGALSLTRFHITPRVGAPIERLSILLGVTGEAGGRELLETVSLTGSSIPQFTENRLQRILLDGSDATMIGYDWDDTVSGRRRLYLHWRSADGFYSQTLDDAAIDSVNLPAFRGPWGIPKQFWQFPRPGTITNYVPLGDGIVWKGNSLDGKGLNPGESVVLSQMLNSSHPINKDYVVSVRLIGLEPDGIHWAWWDLNDSIPAMGAIPTLKWVEGSAVRSPHRVVVSSDSETGQGLTGALILYDAFTNRPLPILDERLTELNPWIPLGDSAIR